MDVRFWAATDVGRTRDHNEDNFLVDKKLNLFIVADGMGGHAAGEVASSLAVREVRRHLAEHRAVIEAFDEKPTNAGREKVLDLIESAIEEACARVHQSAQDDPSRQGMGTTLSMLLIVGPRGFVGHVGDSRIYLCRGEGIHQITEDHSLLNELIKKGKLKPGDAFDSPYKNAVTRAVGVYETVEVDAFDIDVVPEDYFLLCSDGLSCYLDEDLTRRYLTEHTVKESPDKFIAFANESGGKDNITAVVVQLVEADAEASIERTTSVQRRQIAVQSQAIFRYLSYRELVMVMNAGVTQQFKAGTVVFEAGEQCRGIYLILDGEVALESGDTEVAVIRAGRALGEEVLVEIRAQTLRASAKTSVQVLFFDREQLHHVLAQDERIANKVLWGYGQLVSERLRIAQAELASAATLFERMKEGLVDAAELPLRRPDLLAVSALPLEVTEAVMPSFLVGESEGNTDPSFGIDESTGDVSSDDVANPTATTNDAPALDPSFSS